MDIITKFQKLFGTATANATFLALYNNELDLNSCIHLLIRDPGVMRFIEELVQNHIEFLACIDDKKKKEALTMERIIQLESQYIQKLMTMSAEYHRQFKMVIDKIFEQLANDLTTHVVGRIDYIIEKLQTKIEILQDRITSQINVMSDIMSTILTKDNYFLDKQRTPAQLMSLRSVPRDLMKSAIADVHNRLPKRGLGETDLRSEYRKTFEKMFDLAAKNDESLLVHRVDYLKEGERIIQGMSEEPSGNEDFAQYNCVANEVAHDEKTMADMITLFDKIKAEKQFIQNSDFVKLQPQERVRALLEVEHMVRNVAGSLRDLPDLNISPDNLPRYRN